MFDFGIMSVHPCLHNRHIGDNMSKNKHHTHHRKSEHSITMIGLVMTSLGTIISILACNIGLIGWVKSDVSEVRQELRDFKIEVRGWREDLQRDNRDFHARLSVLQEQVTHINSKGSL